ncbi:hypothetical protein BASA60_007232 [Batrachochytrium salamandrivorans]|nr:hypothetical protein BASA60_007232 [Batrachochytrium salamandrivorans]
MAMTIQALSMTQPAKQYVTKYSADSAASAGFSGSASSAASAGSAASAVSSTRVTGVAAAFVNQVSGQWQQNGAPVLQDYQQQSSYTPTLSPSDECGRIADDYGVIPFSTWGKSTESMKTTWGQQGCDQLLCSYWHRKYSVAPFESNGKMPRNIIPA